jgi:exopolyphosphatase/guanosine-5'-triphosphate,3'-diphosphate pyrophosphatase
MDLLGVREVTICPWALREGILLRRLESASWWRERSLELGVTIPRPAAPLADVVPIEAARER